MNLLEEILTEYSYSTLFHRLIDPPDSGSARLGENRPQSSDR
jgi:hypothetical protein